MSDHYSIYQSKFDFECERRARLRTEQLAKQCATLQAENERLKRDYQLLEEMSPPDWVRADFVRHLYDLWADGKDGG